jgi:ribonuclease HII
MGRVEATRLVEEALWRVGFVHVAGVDEVGRGCLAGPVVAAAVVLRADCPIRGLADSKLVPPAERERLAELVRNTALAWAVAEVGPADIDRIAIHRASLESMRLAVTALEPQPDVVLVDAFRIPSWPSRSAASSTATASALHRRRADRRQGAPRSPDVRLDEQTGHGYARHKGYGTPEHSGRARAVRASRHHRRSFWPASLFDKIASGGEPPSAA